MTKWYIATTEDGILTKSYETRKMAISDIPETGILQRAQNEFGVTVCVHESGNIYYVGKKSNLLKQGLRFEKQILAGRARMAHMRTNGTLRIHQQHAAAAFAVKYGRAKLCAKVAEWRSVHRSDVERATDEILEIIGKDSGYKIEYMPFYGDDSKPFILDYAWPDVQVALEMQGNVHTVFGSSERTDYERKRTEILASEGWKVRVISVTSAHDVRSDYVIYELTQILELVETTRAWYDNELQKHIDTHTYDEYSDLDEAPF